MRRIRKVGTWVALWPACTVTLRHRSLVLPSTHRMPRPRKYTEDQVQAVRHLGRAGASLAVIEVETGVSPSSASAIIRGHAYGDVPWPADLHPMGTRSTRSKLPMSTVQRVRVLGSDGVPYREIRRQTGVPESTISGILLGRSYRKIPWPLGCSPRVM